MKASSFLRSPLQKKPVRAAAVPALQDVRISAKLPPVGGNQLGTVFGARRGLEVAQFQLAAIAQRALLRIYVST